jgi:hypothetical protein
MAETDHTDMIDGQFTGSLQPAVYKFGPYLLVKLS